MTATLTFILPDERTEHRLAVDALTIAAGVNDADRQMRSWLKYGHEFKTADEALAACRATLSEVIDVTTFDL